MTTADSPAIAPPAADRSGRPPRTRVARCLDGLEGRFLAELAGRSRSGVLHVARDAQRLAFVRAMARFFAPDLEILEFPAWDCLPYDRVSPQRELMATRLATLAAIAREPRRPRLVIATANALLQRVPPAEALVGAWLDLVSGHALEREALLSFLEQNGYRRTGTVVEPGEYAVRGGIVDVYPSDREQPVRVDFFGNTVDTLRAFDPVTQRSLSRIDRVALQPVSEALLNAANTARFADRYLQEFGAVSDDPLFEAVRSGRSFPGMEHWLPLFYDRLDTLFDYLPEDMPVVMGHLAEEAIAARQAMIGEHYEARRQPDPASRGFGTAPYRPVPPERLYLDEQSLARRLAERPVFELSPLAAPPTPTAGVDRVLDLGARPARDFAAERADRRVNLFDAILAYLDRLREEGRRPVIACSGEGALERLRQVLRDHGLEGDYRIDDLGELAENGVAFAVLPLEHGFLAAGLCLLGEQDLLGERMAHPARRRKRAEQAITELGALREGDLVVHAEHGIGRFEGLVTLEIAGAPHDCLKLVYQGGDRLLLPVENLDILSRYGSPDREVQLDRLGGVGWQQRKARIKKRIREMAEELIEIAAARALRKAPALRLPFGLYEEFAARFPFEETEDQLRAIEAVMEDLASGRPMDRLICGDVGFGKTEVALRAAFVVAMSGKQVAVLCPTTLLARQHFQVFRERFRGIPVRIAQLSRFVTAKEARAVKQGLADGTIDIVIGTHALLAKDVRFRDLGLVVVDEEQHFGVSHKERLKRLRAEVHVLTMTATPIPRTLHMALGGLKDLSIIATPPVDRLAVRTFVMPVDPVVIREAILREYHRGGQIFYVCPHVADQPRLKETLERLVPEVKIGVANGRLPARELERVMGDFYDRRLDLLLSTNIIESGLDIPNANTLIIHRADRFGLAQLYQLRGRIGRAKLRAYAYFTFPADMKLRELAEKRLQVIQSLDGLGAGFQLASHDLDIRGAGNLLGDEQSGHVREVGFELYNHMLEEAVAEIRSRQAAGEAPPAEDWTPQITIDAAALMPESYIGDLDTRLAMYRRLAALDDPAELDAFAAELVDRFGPMPPETEQLLRIIGIKQLCKQAHVAKLDVGPKGVVMVFHDNRFPQPERLIRHITESRGRMRVRPDHRLVVLQETKSPKERLELAHRTVAELAALAA